jgi:uncharacterized protein (TIGR03067 family)
VEVCVFPITGRTARGCALFLFLLLTASAAAAAAELIGTWTGTDAAGAACTIVFGATEWSITRDDGTEWQRGTYTFNDNADPKRLDLYITGSSENEAIAQTALFIYNVEGNTLTLSGGQPGDGYRPAGFAEGGTTQRYTVTGGASDDTDRSDDDDKLDVYVNCFVDLSRE